MQAQNIQVGHCYLRNDGSIRYVEEIVTEADGYCHLLAKSRIVTDPLGEWLGAVGSPIHVFAALSTYECTEDGQPL